MSEREWLPLQPPPGSELLNEAPGWALYRLPDGSVRTFPKVITAEEMAAMMTPREEK